MKKIPSYPTKKLEEKIYYFFVYAQVYTSAFIRSCNWILVIERITSTLKRKVYEKWHNYYFSIFICIIIILYGSIINNIKRIWSDFEDHYYTFSIAFDFITITVSIYLWFINVRLRRLTFNNTKDLSEKFQINENIRLIKLTLPLIISYIFINTGFNFLLNYGESIISDVDLILAYNDFAIFLAYIIIFTYILLKNNIIKYCSYNNSTNIVLSKRNSKIVESAHSNLTGKVRLNLKHQNSSPKNLTIQGKSIPINYKNEDYLRIITKAW